MPGMVDISICTVTLNACDYLRACLASLAENPPRCSYENIVVDNGSSDGTIEMLAQEFPQVRLIKNRDNEGFTRPINQAMQAAEGQYLVLLNPDTLILPGLFDHLLDFLDADPTAGIVGPKVLNRDGSLQKPCRRGESRPWAVISYFLGLSRLFPGSKFFGEYLMNYIDEDQSHQVAGVAGSCMLIRRAVCDQIGFLDERFFAYQEDADYCHRARQAGWKVFYVPAARLVHYGGQGGSRVQPYRSIVAWHRSYFQYYRKHFARDYFFLFNWFYYGLMLLKLGVTLLASLLSKEKHAGPKRG